MQPSVSEMIKMMNDGRIELEREQLAELVSSEFIVATNITTSSPSVIRKSAITAVASVRNQFDLFVLFVNGSAFQYKSHNILEVLEDVGFIESTTTAVAALMAGSTRIEKENNNE